MAEGQRTKEEMEAIAIAEWSRALVHGGGLGFWAPETVDAFENIDGAPGALKRGFELWDLWRALF